MILDTQRHNAPEQQLGWLHRPHARPIIRKLIVGAIPAIMKFMLMNSGMKLLSTFCQYVPPIIDFMNSD